MNAESIERGWLTLDTRIEFNRDAIQSPNLLDRFEEYDLARLGTWISDGYERDKMSRSTWERRMDAAMDLAMQVQKDKTWPWPGCSNVVFPLVTIGALNFSAQAYPQIVQGNRVVRYRVVGGDQGETRKRASRISRHMSWQVLEEDESWEEQHDRMLINLAIVGCNFIKSRFDASKGYPVDELVMARDLVVDYSAKSIEGAARKTHVIPMYRNEIYERILQDTYRDVRDEAWFRQPPGTALSEMPSRDLRAGLTNGSPDRATAYSMLEQHVLLDLDQDGYEEPYIATIEKTSKRPVRLVARVDDERQVERKRGGEIIKITPTEYFTKFSFIPSPDGGIYDLGFGIFLGPVNEAVNSGINQLLDNGTMQNSIGGFLGRGAKIRGGVYTMAPWEWKRVDSTGDDLRKNIVPFPERAPSQVMLSLISLLIEYANRIAGTTDAQVGENPGQNTPAQTYQGMQEQGKQTYKMIFKRVWRSMKQEYKKRYAINRRYLPAVQRFGEGSDFIRKEDYLASPDQVAPVANPNVTSTQMRIGQATAVKQDSMQTAGYDRDEVTRQWLDALDVESSEAIFPGMEKTGPLPNPKMMVEQGKMQLGMAKIKAEMRRFQMQLMQDRHENQAKVIKLMAEAAKISAEAKTEGAEHRLKALEMILEHHRAQDEMFNQRLETLAGMGQEGENAEGTSGTSERGGAEGMAGGAGNAGVSGVPA
jgi:chaperonin GroES